MTTHTLLPGRVFLHLGLLGAALVSPACSSGSCRPPIAPQRDMGDASPAVRSRALALVPTVPSGPRGEAVAALIERLGDADATVRMQAYVRLREATGHDSGYRPFFDAGERMRHIEAWWAWWRGELARPVVAEPEAPINDVSETDDGSLEAPPASLGTPPAERSQAPDEEGA